MLDWIFTSKRDHRKLKNKYVEFELQLITFNGSAFDNYVVSNNLTIWLLTVNNIKNSKGKIS